MKKQTGKSKFICETPIAKAQQPNGYLRRSVIGKLNNPDGGGMQADGIMPRSLPRRLFPKLALVVIPVIILMSFVFAHAADIKKPAAAANPLPAVPATEQPQIQQPAQAQKAPEDNYKYYPLGKPDPFHPFVEIVIAPKKKEEKKVSPYPLERDEIEKFRLAGIVGDQAQRLAIVEVMEEGKLKFYPLLRGTHIGLRKGQVMEILADRVIVEEIDKNKTKRIILKLHKDNEVTP